MFDHSNSVLRLQPFDVVQRCPLFGCNFGRGPKSVEHIRWVSERMTESLLLLCEIEAVDAVRVDEAVASVDQYRLPSVVDLILCAGSCRFDDDDPRAVRCAIPPTEHGLLEPLDVDLEKLHIRSRWHVLTPDVRQRVDRRADLVYGVACAPQCFTDRVVRGRQAGIGHDVHQHTAGVRAECHP